MKNKNSKQDKNNERIRKAKSHIASHPIFYPMFRYIRFEFENKYKFALDDWCFITDKGHIYVNIHKKGSIDEWVFVFAHSLLHLAFEHFKAREDKEDKRLWNIACDAYIHQFLKDMKVGKPPLEMCSNIAKRIQSEEKLYNELVLKPELAKNYIIHSTMNSNKDMFEQVDRYYYYYDKATDWKKLFANGLADSVSKAIQVASGTMKSMYDEKNVLSKALQAKNWFISSYPLLGALASSFDIVEDPQVCRINEISVAAVNESLKEIYISPSANLNDEELKFVIAHELLHVGLRHGSRCRGRDPYLWNVACDYVINQWLIEMGIGIFPTVGGLFDEELKGLSAESVYDRIVTDMRKYRKLMTLRGQGIGDIIESTKGQNDISPMDLDDFYRSCLSQGLTYHQQSSRGELPSGLIEEIRALSQPPIPWDVELAKWFDNYFKPIEKVRSYARPSRRQASTPNIPRPRYVNNSGDEDGRTFAVVLDTSGSMDRTLLAMALGSIASYATTRDVFKVRVLFCDAAVYDQGYMSPDIIADKVKVRGRGGTVLQPAIDKLEKAEDFPKGGPVLIITDGFCDKLTIKNDHAYLIPEGNRLPFIPRGKVFRLSKGD